MESVRAPEECFFLNPVVKQFFALSLYILYNNQGSVFGFFFFCLSLIRAALDTVEVSSFSFFRTCIITNTFFFFPSSSERK
jgi:hypothetical protein